MGFGETSTRWCVKKYGYFRRHSCVCAHRATTVKIPLDDDDASDDASDDVHRSVVHRQSATRAMSSVDADAFKTSFIGRLTRVRCRDGRVFVGTLRCVDKQRNVVIGNAREYARDGDEQGEPRRTIAMVLIAKSERMTMHCIECEEGEDVATAFGTLAV